MPLPDVSRFASLRPADWGVLGLRLRAIGLDAEYVTRLLRSGEHVEALLRGPMRLWLARRRREPAAYAVRMFILGDPVAPEDAREALGDFTKYIEAGLLAQTPAGVVSPFRMNAIFERYFLGDDLTHGGDAVMGPSGTSAYLAFAARTYRPEASLIEIGTGSGAVAIALSDTVGRVVATDSNPRALVIAAANAHLNGATNIEFRAGDLFEPVRGETFDFVIAQPPFVAQPPGSHATPFLFGGTRGDEIALRLFSKIGDHIKDGGRGIVLVDWPVVEAEPIDQRLRRAIPEVDLDAVVLLAPARNLEEHCTLHAAYEHLFDGRFTEVAIAMREHLANQQIESLRLALVVVERTSSPPALTKIIATSHFNDAPPTPQTVARIVRTQSLLARPNEALIDAAFVIPEGTTFDESAIGDAVHVVVRLPPASLVPSFAVDSSIVDAARRVQRASTLRAAIAAIPHAEQEPFVRDAVEAIKRGLLELSSLQ